MATLRDYIGLTDEELRTLTDFADLVEPPRRPTYRQDPDGYIRLHAIHNCRVWKQGVGVVVGDADWSPAKILSDRKETVKPCGCIMDAGVTVSPCQVHRDHRVRAAIRRLAQIEVDRA